MDSNNNFDINDEQESSQLGNNTRSTYIRFESEYSDEFATNDNDFRPDITNTASSLPRYQPELVGVERHERAKPPVFLTLNLPDFCGCLSEIRINSKTASVIAIATNIIIHTIFLFNHVKTGGDVYNNWPLKIEFCIEWTFVLIAVLGILFSRSNLVLPYIIVVMLEVIEELVMLIIDFRRYPNDRVAAVFTVIPLRVLLLP